MTFLPIVERELRAAARSRWLYRNRIITAAVVAAVAVIMLMFASGTSVPSLIGRGTFRVLSVLALLFCLLEGTRKTADCVSVEKREGTLGLLFLTDLRGYDVILGKLVSNSLNSVYGLVAILPIIALPLTVGGVTPAEYWRMVLALLHILFFSLSVGMAMSTLCREDRKSVGGTILVVLVLGVAPILPALVPKLPFARAWHVISPIDAFRTAFDASYAAESGAYWQSLGLTQAWSWLALALAAFVVTRSWQERNEGERRRWIPQARSFSPAARAKMLELNPVYWLAKRNMGRRGLLVLALIATVIAAGWFACSGDLDNLQGYVAFCLAINLALKMRVGVDSTRLFAEARRNNALEMLLATPLTVERIIQGQWVALERTYRMPVIVILVLQFGGLLTGVVYASALGPGMSVDGIISILVVVCPFYVLLFIGDMAAVAWAGMWFGLSSKQESRAASNTVLLVLGLPLATLILPCANVAIFLGSPVFWISWASGKVRQELRRMASENYGLRPVGGDWRTMPSGQILPAPPRLPFADRIAGGGTTT